MNVSDIEVREWQVLYVGTFISFGNEDLRVISVNLDISIG